VGLIACHFNAGLRPALMVAALSGPGVLVLLWSWGTDKYQFIPSSSGWRKTCKPWKGEINQRCDLRWRWPPFQGWVFWFCYEVEGPDKYPLYSVIIGLKKDFQALKGRNSLALRPVLMVSAFSGLSVLVLLWSWGPVNISFIPLSSGWRKISKPWKGQIYQRRSQACD